MYQAWIRNASTSDIVYLLSSDDEALVLIPLPAFEATESYPQLVPWPSDILRAYAHYRRSTFPFCVQSKNAILKLVAVYDSQLRLAT